MTMTMKKQMQMTRNMKTTVMTTMPMIGDTERADNDDDIHDDGTMLTKSDNDDGGDDDDADDRRCRAI